MPGPRLSRKRSSAVELRAAYMRPLRGVSLWGKTIYSNQPKMRQCLCKAVCGNVVGDIIRGGLGGIAGVAHGDADPGIFQHRHVVAAVAKGDGLLPRQAQMGQRVGQAVGLAAARG